MEAGGTKFVCAVGTGPDDVRAELRIPTATPQDTLPRVVEFFARHAARAPLAAVGVACFGPVEVDRRSRRWGSITATTKRGWSDTDVGGLLRRALGVPVAFDSDVNGAALGEHRWGAGRGLDSFVYVTVGTGIGGGAVVAGRPVHGLLHPERGHMRVPHDRDVDPFPGACAFHGDCLEGLASGRAIRERWGRDGEALPAEHPAWPLEARYLALGLVNVICALSPQRIAIGGGVMSRSALLPRIRADVVALLAGYVGAPAILERIDDYLVTPALGARAGVLGALALAQDALAAQSSLTS